MSFSQPFTGRIKVRLTSADLGNSLSAIMEMGIPVLCVEAVGELEALFSVSRNHYQMLKSYTERNGDRLTIVNYTGAYWTVRNILRRPLMWISCVLLIITAVFVSGRVLLISVDGNEIIPQRRIMEAAKECGLCFGTPRRQIRSEVIKNRMISKLPQLQWVGINTYGCHAVISVRERSVDEEIKKIPGISNIVALRDGIVLSCTVTDGTAQCVPGQAVTVGQVLISGYSDQSRIVTGTHAQGDVIGSTRHQFTAVTPQDHAIRVRETERTEKLSLLIGKKRINFNKGSGISCSSCVKMYKEYVLSLPGGFNLPVILIKETFADYALSDECIAEGVAAEQLSDFAENNLKQNMIAGTIESRTESVTQVCGVFRLDGWYACTEIIGKRQIEKIGEYHGKSNGTDRERGSGG